MRLLQLLPVHQERRGRRVDGLQTRMPPVFTMGSTEFVLRYPGAWMRGGTGDQADYQLVGEELVGVVGRR